MDREIAFRKFLPVCFMVVSQFAMASTWYVDGIHGSDNNNCKSPQEACKTIRHAISLASAGDSVIVAAATYTENLTISMSLNVIGSGAKMTIIDGGAVDTVVRISNANAHVTLSYVTIENGNSMKGAGVSNSGTLTIKNTVISGNNTQFGEGGGVDNFGTLTIEDTVLAGNTALRGGGVVTYGSLTIENTTISNNRVSEVGGGILNFGTLRIDRSTISNNKCCGVLFTEGAGIDNVNGATLTVNNSTISGNSGRFGIFNGFAKITISSSTVSGNGGGIEDDSGTAAIQNSILASNGTLNCYGTMTSNGYNLSSDDTCNFNGPGDMNNIDPQLGNLGHYGGPTQTIPLLAGSLAIDSGNPNGCTDGDGRLQKTDQRGQPRPDKEDLGGCDRGAYERQSD